MLLQLVSNLAKGVIKIFQSLRILSIFFTLLTLSFGNFFSEADLSNNFLIKFVYYPYPKSVFTHSHLDSFPQIC